MDIFDLEKEQRIHITCAKAVEDYLAQEVDELGYDVLKKSAAGVETEGTFNDCMLLNLYLRTAHRVLLTIAEFRATDPDELYQGVARIPWEKLIDAHGYVSVVATANTTAVKNTRFAGLKAKDAIVDRILKERGARPNSGPDKTQTVVALHWQDDLVRISLDTSGVPLSNRGYRTMPHKAPMRETLAAAALLAAGYTGEGAVVNPMCGSGTLALEAALIASHTAPGLLRDNFGFMHVLGYDPAEWTEMRNDALSRRKAPEWQIIATDRDPKAIEAAQNNAKNAALSSVVDFAVCDFRATEIPEEQGEGIVILNPEYGERLGEEKALEEVYRGIGDFFKSECKGYTGAIFTGNRNLAKCIGLKTRRKIPLFNGPIECRLLLFDLYAGSRREDKK